MARINFTRAALNALLSTRTPQVKFQSFTDSSGMTVTLRSHATGATVLFFCKKRIKGKLHTKGLGGYPDTSLDQARYAFLTAAAELIHNGCFKKPAAVSSKSAAIPAALSFGDVVERFLAYKQPTLSQRTYGNYSSYLANLTPYLNVEFQDITAAYIWDNVLGPMVSRSPSLAGNLSVLLKSIGRYAVAMEYCIKNPFDGLSVLMPKVTGGHFKSYADDELEDSLKALFKKVACLPGPKRAAIHFAFYCPLRNSELRSLTVAQMAAADTVTVKTKTWDAFAMPLSLQAQRVAQYITAELQPRHFLFESARGNQVTLSYFNLALRDAGVDDFVIHGVRSCCMQFLVKCDGVKETIASMCLAHKVGNKTEQAYNRGEYLDERRKAMQMWGDFVEKCAGGTVFY